MISLPIIVYKTEEFINKIKCLKIISCIPFRFPYQSIELFISLKIYIYLN